MPHHPRLLLLLRSQSMLPLLSRQMIRKCRHYVLPRDANELLRQIALCQNGRRSIFNQPLCILPKPFIALRGENDTSMSRSHPLVQLMDGHARGVRAEIIKHEQERTLLSLQLAQGQVEIKVIDQVACKGRQLRFLQPLFVKQVVGRVPIAIAEGSIQPILDAAKKRLILVVWSPEGIRRQGFEIQMLACGPVESHERWRVNASEQFSATLNHRKVPAIQTQLQHIKDHTPKQTIS